MKEMNAQVQPVAIEKLHIHPFNALIYDDESRPEEYTGLVTSIKEHGIKEPLFVTENFILLSGHRRLKVAKELNLLTVPCVFENPENEELAIIEHNRYRRKTVSELMREAEELLKVETLKAEDRKRFQSGPGGEKGRTTERVAKALGIGSATQLSKLKKVWEAAKTNPQIAKKMNDVDAAKTSINALFKSLNPQGKEDFGFDLQIFSNWHFPIPDPTLGQVHPGRIPGQVVENLIYYYTNPGDLVYDPFGGGGITIDAAKRMNRRAIVTDIAPVRPDIMQWDITVGFPQMTQGAQLIFLDPPYWNMLKDAYVNLSQDSAAGLTLEQFQAFMENVCLDAFETLKPGGYLAIIMNPQTHKLPEGVPYIDWPFECRIFMDQAGFVPIARIVERLPTSMYNASQVITAKESKRMLQTHGDIVVGVKP